MPKLLKELIKNCYLDASDNVPVENESTFYTLMADLYLTETDVNVFKLSSDWMSKLPRGKRHTCP